MLNCYIVDDEIHALNVLAGYVNKTPNINLVGSSEDPVVALQQINRLVPDIAFLDVDMPTMTGLELSRLINRQTAVIFTTAHANYAVDAFDMDTVDFLLKPIKYERFLKSVEKITEMRRNSGPEVITITQKDHIFIQSGLKGQMVRIRLRDIDYIESTNNYITIYLPNNQSHVVYITLKETLDTLPEEMFSRIHKSIIVNDEKIQSVEGNRVIIDEQTSLPIGNTFREPFLEKISKYLVRRK